MKKKKEGRKDGWIEYEEFCEEADEVNEIEVRATLKEGEWKKKQNWPCCTLR